jgi:outer membrane protein assembly factor BamB
MDRDYISSRRDLLKLSLSIGVTGILYGCGGGNSRETPTSASAQGSAQFKITRYLPSYANSIVAELTLPSDPNVRHTLLSNRPDTLPASQTMTFNNLPAGTTYHLQCRAYVEREGRGEVVAMASTEVSIQAGQTTRASLVLGSTIQTIEIQGQPLRSVAGACLTLTGRVLDASNNILLLPPNALTWSIVSGATLGSITPTGELRTTSVGTIRVRLAESAARISAEADIQVVHPDNGLASSPWPRFQRNNQGTGRGKGSGAVGQIKWSFPTGNAIDGSPVIGTDGTIYVGSQDTKFYALNGATGALKWVFPTGDQVFCSPALGADGTVYMGSADRKIYALDGATGAKKWEFLTGQSVHSSPAIGPDGTLYIGSLDGKVYALEGASGALKWSFRTSSSVFASPTIGLNGMVYVGSLDGQFYALNEATGTVRWQFQASRAIDGSAALGATPGCEGTVYFGDYDGNFYALDGATGAKKWQYVTGDRINGSPVVDLDGTVYIGSWDDHLYALNGVTGALKWRFRTGGRICSTPAIDAAGILYVGSHDWKLHALDTATGTQKWQFPTGDYIYSSPTIGLDGTIYVGSFDYKVYAIR